MVLVSYPRLLKLLVIALLFSLAAFVVHKGSLQAQSRVASGRVTNGEEMFRQSCASSYCHGEQGKGGGAPPLRDGSMDAERVTEVIVAGVPGTAMPAFGDRFSAAELAQLTSYILSLPNGEAAPDDVKTQPSAQQDPGTPGTRASENEPVGSSSVNGVVREFAAGRELFFGADQIDNCRVCHTFGGKGGQVGPDLSDIGSKTESEILESILKPSARIAPGYESIVVQLRDGRRIAGVKRDETPERLRIYDTASLPPVSRSIVKSEIASIEQTPSSAMPSRYGARFSETQLRELVSFLRGK